MEPIILSAERPFLELQQADGTTKRWEYDVISLKLECERIEEAHKTQGKPSVSMLADFAAYLVVAGLDGCTLDIALRVWSLAQFQFGKLASSIAAQLENLD